MSDTTETETESEESTTGTSSILTSIRASASPTNSIVVLPGNGGYNGGGGGSYELPDSPTSSSNASREGSTSLTPKLVGGIIGGLAGAALFLWVILLLIRRHKQNVLVNQRVEAGYGGPPPVAMTERSSITPISGAGFWSLGRSSRQSQASEPVSEERGFYKVSGRKLPPVIGGPRPDLSAQTSSFFQDEENRWLGGPRTPVASPISPTSPASLTSSGPSRYSGATQATASPTSSAFGQAGAPVGLSFSSHAGPSSYPHAGPSSAPHSYPHTVAHPSSTPARIPEENGEEHYQAEIDRDRANTPRLSVQRSRDLAGTPVSQLRDGLGRSLPSLDGSRTSRFTEDIV